MSTKESWQAEIPQPIYDEQPGYNKRDYILGTFP